MADKEATARIKINQLLEVAGGRFFAEGALPANIQLEPSVTIKTQDLDALGENFEKSSKGFINTQLIEVLMKKKVLLFIVLLVSSMAAGSAQAKEMRPEGVTLYSETLLAEINRYRQDHGLNTLRFEPGLIRLAKNHSFEMFQQKMLSHRNFQDRFQQADSNLCVENVGWNYTNPLKQFDGWRRSPDHNKNMLAGGIQKAGIAEVGNYVTFFACK